MSLDKTLVKDICFSSWEALPVDDAGTSVGEKEKDVRTVSGCHVQDYYSTADNDLIFVC